MVFILIRRQWARLRLRAAALLHRLRELRCRDGFGKAHGSAVGVGQGFDVFVAGAGKHNHGKGPSTAVNGADQGQSMRPVFAINHSQIQILANCADQIQDIVRAVRAVAEASRFQKDLSHAFFNALVVRQESYDGCLHAPRIHEDRDARSAVIAI